MKLSSGLGVVAEELSDLRQGVTSSVCLICKIKGLRGPHDCHGPSFRSMALKCLGMSRCLVEIYVSCSQESVCPTSPMTDV